MSLIKEKITSTPFLYSFLFLLGITFITGIDQFFKHKIRLNGGFYVCNNGISFNLPLNIVLFWLILSFFLVIGFFYYQYLSNNGLLTPLLISAFTLMAGGGLSNGIDRLFLGCIVDFLSLNLTFFPFFNWADVAISLGSCLFFLVLTLQKKSSCV